MAGKQHLTPYEHKQLGTRLEQFLNLLTELRSLKEHFNTVAEGLVKDLEDGLYLVHNRLVEVKGGQISVKETVEQL